MGLVNNPTVSENEYARILLEEGILGLLIWICFIAWVLFNRNAFQKTEWLIARRLCYVLVLANFAVSNIGMGMLTAIPGTFIMFFMIGWIVTVPPVEEQAPDRAIQPAASRGAVPARPDKLAFPGRTIADA
jgi:O-antigen ligase